jgi:iron(III) transport system substrate-binding protein
MKNLFILINLLCLLKISVPIYGSEKNINIYSARKEELILPLLKIFKKETGINYKLITGKADGLLKRLEIEGKLSPADIFITVDAGRLQRAKNAGVLQQINNKILLEKIPGNLRDSNNYWFGLSQRSRTIIYNKNKVSEKSLSTYENLAEPKWKGRLCIRSSSSIYNQSLVASMIVANGKVRTEEWAKGLVKNFARPPAGGDTDLLKATAAGQCDIALANTYYLGRMKNSKLEQVRKASENLLVFWPNQNEDERGAHVNVSGAGITKYSKNIKNAEALLEFLVKDDSQRWYAEVNNEYPVVNGIDESDTLKGFGKFRADTLNLSRLGEMNREAVKLMDRAGWR